MRPRETPWPWPHTRSSSRAVGAGLARDFHCDDLQILDPHPSRFSEGRYRGQGPLLQRQANSQIKGRVRRCTITMKSGPCLFQVFVYHLVRTGKMSHFCNGCPLIFSQHIFTLNLDTWEPDPDYDIIAKGLLSFMEISVQKYPRVYPRKEYVLTREEFVPHPPVAACQV